MHPGEQFIILFDGLGETESRVKNYLLHSGLLQPLHFLFEIGTDFGRDIAVIGQLLHVVGHSPHLHRDVGHPEAGGGAEHGRIGLSGGNVVDQAGAIVADDPFGYFGPERVERNG